jgi:alanyl-tRNA synthetase
LVNAQIRGNAAAQTRLMSYDEAVGAGAMALFGEKYGDEVRVLQLGDFSTELCGGTHVERAGDIGLFRIVSESGIAAGIRRIEAITGQAALDQVRADEALLNRLTGLVKAGPGEVEQRVAQVLERNKSLEKELQQLKAQIAGGAGGSDPTDAAVEIGDLRVLASRVADDLDVKTLRDTLDRLKSRLGRGVVVLGCATADGKVRLVAGVSKDLTKTLRAGDIVNAVAADVGGKGGGRPDFAQAGGNDPAGLDAALAAVPERVRAALG